MNGTHLPAAEKQPGSGNRPGQAAGLSSEAPLPHHRSQPGTPAQAGPGPGKQPALKVSKGLTLSGGGTALELEVFTLTLGEETIDLLPLKNWNQLDHYKWTVRGKLPGAPAGLEITHDHVRITGGTVAIKDPAGCDKLERLFNEWLLFELENVELARKKARPQPLPAAQEPSAQAAAPPLRFRVEVDKRGQVHVQCLQGREALASIGLSLAGFSSLHQQGLMRKPHTLAAGALHDWVELDGELFSFEKGRNDAARLEQVLNERYVPAATTGAGKEVVVFLNPASSTGFDIQFPVMVAGAPDNRRHHLDDHSLELLQDQDHCGLLHKGIIVKLIPPNLVFKQKTADGGEQYLPWGQENVVTVTDEEGHQKTIALHQPLNLLRLGAADLTAVFNHPAINRHSKAAPPPSPASEPEARPATPSAAPQVPCQPAPPSFKQEPSPKVREPGPDLTEPKPLRPAPVSAPKPAAASTGPKRVNVARPQPNLWLAEVLAQPAHHHEWFASLAYTRMAEWFGNSGQGTFGPCECWFISLGESEDIADPAFKGVFITEKGSLGFLNKGQMARFYNQIAFVGPRQSALEGIQVDLVAVGLDARQRLVFILSDNYRAQFGVQEATVNEVLKGLSESGAVIMSVREVLASPEPLEVVWTVPADQPDPSSPDAQENRRPPV